MKRHLVLKGPYFKSSEKCPFDPDSSCGAGSYHNYSHLTGEETEVQRSKVSKQSFSRTPPLGFSFLLYPADPLGESVPRDIEGWLLSA